MLKEQLFNGKILYENSGRLGVNLYSLTIGFQQTFHNIIDYVSFILECGVYLWMGCKQFYGAGYGWPLPPKIQKFQMVQTKHNWFMCRLRDSTDN